MDFNLKNYQVFKTKNYLKNYSFLLFYNTAKLKIKEWITIEQNLKTLKLNYYKVFNGTTIKTFKNSSFKNFDKTICNIVLFITPKYKTTQIKIEILKKQLKSFFILINIKLNNKIYSIDQIKNIKLFSYTKTMFNFYTSLNKHLKVSSILTKKKNRNNVI